VILAKRQRAHYTALKIMQRRTYWHKSNRLQNLCFKNEHCKECLKQGECAFYVAGETDETGPKTGCYETYQIDDEMFAAGTFYEGGDKQLNKKQCKAAKKAARTCEETDKCNQCLKNDECAWKVKGGLQNCVSAQSESCYMGWGEGQCFTGATFPDTNKACRRMKKGKPPLKCKTYNGKGNCRSCMTNGCYWSNEDQKCLKSCDNVAEGTTCRGTYAPTDGRKLLSFGDEASMLCYYLDIEYQDMKKCEASDGDCSTCLETTLTPQWPSFEGDPLVIPKTCEYLPETGKCVPDGGEDKCGDYCNQKWPQLQGRNVWVAESFLINLGEGYNVVLCNKGQELIFPEPELLPDVEAPTDVKAVITEKSLNLACTDKDLQCDRIRLFFDGSQIQFGGPLVSNIPQLG